MEIHDALKETEIATPDYVNSKKESHAKLFDGILYWYDVKKDEYLLPVTLQGINNINWQPYPEVKEIRPKNSDEVWINNHGRCMVLGWGKGELWGYFSDGGKCTVLDEGSLAVHGKNGWERIHPKVEDDSVDEMKFEAVTWGKCDCGFNYPMGGRGSFQNNDKLLNKKPMGMILKIPKEA